MNYVIISAYKAEKFIKECLDSVHKEGVQILLGIDGCPKTLAKIKTINKKYPNLRTFYFPENSGPYVVFNTLIEKLSDDDTFIIFGADDVMNPGMVGEMIKNKPCISKHIGVICLDKSMFDEFGGFMPWRVDADNNLLKRIEKKHKVKVLPRMFFRREHEGQLTKGRHGLKSEYRRILKSITRKMLRENRLYVTPVYSDGYEI